MKERRICDLHCHILYGIDDGAQTLEESVKMARMMYAQGVRAACCTSHSMDYMSEYVYRLDRVKERLAEEKIDIRLYSGCEVFCSGKNIEYTAGRVKEGYYHRLGDSRYVLLEFYPDEDSSTIVSSAERFLGYGYGIVIAHVERCLGLHDDREAVERLKDMGCLFQINSYSIVKETDERIRGFARGMVLRQEASFLGSDGHRILHRPPDIKAGVEYIYANCSEEYADMLCYGNAVRMLSGDWVR